MSVGSSNKESNYLGKGNYKGRGRGNNDGSGRGNYEGKGRGNYDPNYQRKNGGNGGGANDN